MIGKPSRTVRTLATAVGLAILAAAPAAGAQEAIATAADAPLGGAPTPQPAPPLDAQRRLPGGEDMIRNVNACGAPPKEDGTKDKSPHGEVFAGVGNHGYREAGGVVCVPLGDHVAATIAIDAGRYPGWRGRPY
jgi:hypothetical protein